jgi:glyoxylase-like metal-dependent hydrolase (beta-lactamase superfamily II)
MDEGRTKHWQIGKIGVTRIQELIDSYPPARMFIDDPTALIERNDWLKEFVSAEGNFSLSLHAFVIVSGNRRILVDSSVGNDKPREDPMLNNLRTPFLEELLAAGCPPETIDTVICTHLHVDHVGWNTRLSQGKWVPTFPNARYIFGRREWETCQQLLLDKDERFSYIVDSVQPIVDAGLADLVEADHRITDEVWLEPSPGHTPGHVCVHIASEGHHAVITGDVFHHPIQIADPDFGTKFCMDNATACQTRRAFLSRYENKQALILSSHFPATAGWILRDRGGWRFSPA